jgi:multidrug efflux pump subunit AcrB
MGDREYVMRTNSSPDDLSALNDLSIRAANGAVVYMKDVAQVHMGFVEQTNIVRENGKRSALLMVLKNGETSTLNIVSQTISMVPQLTAGLGNLKITPLFDQSILCGRRSTR